MCSCNVENWCDDCIEYYQHQQELEYEEYVKRLKEYVRKENKD